jgi:hypothetical protein
MSISEHFRYRNDVFQSDIFVSDIGITDVDVGCRISPIWRSMSMPTYANEPHELPVTVCNVHVQNSVHNTSPGPVLMIIVGRLVI